MASVLNGLSATCSPAGPVTISSFICLDPVQPDIFQYRLATGVGDLILGISQTGSNIAPNLYNTLSGGTFNPAAAAANPGEELKSYNFGDVQVPLVLGLGGASANAMLTADASGHGIMVGAGSGVRYGAIALMSGNAGDIVPVAIVCDKA